MKALPTDRLPTRREIDRHGAVADRFYDKLRAKLEAEHWSKYITIHPVNGDYAIGRTLEAAFNKMNKKYPREAFFSYRFGYEAVVHFGGSGASDGKRPKVAQV